MGRSESVLESESERVSRAARMLLGGATLLGQPCPYCSGVRVLKDGYALCVSCGQEPEDMPEPAGLSSAGLDAPPEKGTHDPERVVYMLEKKIIALSAELAVETDSQKEIRILESIEMVMAAIQKAKQMQ